MWSALLILLGLLLVSLAWVGLFFPRLFRNRKNPEKSYGRKQLFGNFIGWGIASLVVAMFVVPGADEGEKIQTQAQTVNADVDASAVEKVENSAVKAEIVEAKTLPYDAQTIVKQINANLKEAGIRHVVRLPSEKRVGSVKDIMQVSVEEELALTFTFTKEMDKPDSLSIVVGLSNPEQIIERIFVASLMMAAVIGEGGKDGLADTIIVAFGQALSEFDKSDKQKDIKKGLVVEGVAFSVSIVPGVGVFVTADGGS